MDPDYYQQHWAQIRIIRRNRELMNRIQQQQQPVQPPPPQDVPAVPQPPPPPIVVPPPPPAIQQDLAHLPQVLQAAQLHTPDIQDAQEQVPNIVQPPPPPVKINPRNLPTPPEVKRTNLSDSLNLEEEEEVIVPVIFQDDPTTASTSDPATPAATDKTPPILPDVWPPPSAASTPASGVETIHDSPDSFHSLSDQDASTILHTPDNAPPQSSLATAKKSKSSSSVVQLFQDFQGAAQQVALKITKPQDPPVPRDPEVLSPCPKHGTVVNFSLSNLQEIDQRKCTCPTEPGPTELPPTITSRQQGPRHYHHALTSLPLEPSFHRMATTRFAIILLRHYL